MSGEPTRPLTRFLAPDAGERTCQGALHVLDAAGVPVLHAEAAALRRRIDAFD